MKAKSPHAGAYRLIYAYAAGRRVHDGDGIHRTRPGAAGAGQPWSGTPHDGQRAIVANPGHSRKVVG